MKEDATKLLQEYINIMQANGLTPTMEELNIKMREIIQLQNNAPKKDFEGYSPIEMDMIINYTFNSKSPIQLNTLAPQEYDQIPILRQIKRLVDIISRDGKIKLTTAGYLPVKIVKELYLLGIPDEMIESGITKLYREGECIPVHMARVIAIVSGVVKERTGTLTLTSKGKTIIADDAKLLEAIFIGFCQKYNWGYFDGYNNDINIGSIGQMGFGLSLIMLSIHGQTKHADIFYAEKYFKAFPMLLESVRPTYRTVQEYCSDCYSLRTFQRFLNHFGLIEISKIIQNMKEEVYIKKTPLFDKFISIKPHSEFEIK